MFDSEISNPSAREAVDRSSSEEENKLDGLNRMLKEGGLNKLMSLDNDQSDFELFVSKLKTRDLKKETSPPKEEEEERAKDAS